MTLLQIVRAAIPSANRNLAEHILWGRTAFPCGRSNAKIIYRAASRFARAGRNGLHLCDLCDRLAVVGDLCERCDTALRRTREERWAS